MTDQDRVALEFFRNLMARWGCSPEQQIRLLGCGDRTDLCELERWQAHGLPHDALLRISHIMGIHRALRSIFGDNPAAYTWISRPNDAPPFAGRAALELLIDGRFAEVREYLAAVSGKTIEEILEAKRRRQQELIDAIQAASPEELEASAKKIRDVMRASRGGRRQRMTPPANHLVDIILAAARVKPEGYWVSPNEFLHLGDRATVDETMSQLTREGRLLRVWRGAYVLPVQGRFGPRPPTTEAVLHAIEANLGETVVPNGAAEANTLGLTTQVPVREVFLTSGPSRMLRFDERLVELKHGNRWQLMLGKHLAGQVVRALLWLGPEAAPEALKRLQPRLPESEWEALCGARARLPGWMAKLISEAIAKEKSGSMETRRPRDLNLHKSKPETD